MTDQPTGQALATLENISDLVEGRDKAIALWLSAYDTLHSTTDEAARASIGGSIGLYAASTERYGGDHGFSQAFLNTKPVRHDDRVTWKTTETPARDAFAAKLAAEVDRRCWDHLMKHLGFDQLLDRVAREEFEAGMKPTPPEFNEANCTATFGGIWGNRRDMYLRGIANVFMAMDRRFRSHDAFAVGNRLVIDRAFNEWGSWDNYNRRDTLHDVERIFLELDGKPLVARDGGIVAVAAALAHDRKNLPAVAEGDYFRCRAFKNGNLHLWFTNKPLLAQVNALLLEYYKPVEGDVATDGPSYESGPLYHQTPAKNFGAFFSSDAVAAAVMSQAEIAEGMTVLEPSAGSGVLAKAARAKGGRIVCVELQPGLAHELRNVHGFADTREDNFLRMDPARFPAFDRIVMNPPFDRGRDCDHVRHAYQFLKPGGRLVAVMSARAEFGTDARHKALHDLVAQAHKGRWMGRDWTDLPDKSFAHAGTNVNTAILTIHKPR